MRVLNDIRCPNNCISILVIPLFGVQYFFFRLVIAIVFVQLFQSCWILGGLHTPRANARGFWIIAALRLFRQGDGLETV